jgi:predicted AlkP superfamily phosphohydrolase/phosphomutase
LETHEHMQKSAARPRKIFLLALDSTPLAFLRDNASALPNVTTLLKGGQLLNPKSSANRFSASPWPTFASGLMPGEHGHYFPLQWDPADMRFIPVKGKVLEFQPFWDVLSREGVEIIVFDAMSVPLTDAPGIQLLNWNSQSNFPPCSNRPEILRYIRKNFGKKPIGDEIAVKKSRSTLAKLRDRLIKSTKLKTDAILWLMQTFDWQCFITGYYEGHRAGHNLWPIRDDSDTPEDAMLDVYREIDTQVGRLLKALDHSETGLFLFSMHGMTPGFSQDHFLVPVIESINNLYLRERGHEVPRRNPGLAHALRSTVPPFVQLHVREMVGQNVQDWLIDREWRGGKDWKSTPALPVPGGGDVGFVRLSIEGRERDGFLPASEAGRNDYIEFLSRALRRLRVKETGEPLVKEIVLTEDEFPGPCRQILPDVLVNWQPDTPANEIWSEDVGTISAKLKTGRGGSHTGESFALLAGALNGVEGLPPLPHIRDYKSFVRAYFAQA